MESRLCDGSADLSPSLIQELDHLQFFSLGEGVG
jgi:hypothetical protein